MKQEIEELKKGIECKDCGTVMSVLKSKDIKKIKCMCGVSNWVILFNEMGDNEEQEVRAILGKTYEKVLGLIDRYMDMPENFQKLVAVWILGTYLHETFNTYPFIFINAMRGSGKTRLLKIISALSKGSNHQIQTGLSESVFFRTPAHITMVLDECESISSKEKQSFREYLNASYKKGGTVSRAKRVRNKEGEDWQIETFQPFKPLAMANINGMDEVLGDRCVSFVLSKSNNPGKTKLIEDFDSNIDFENVKRTLETIQCSLCSVVVAQNSGKGWNNYILDKYKHLNNYTSYTTTLATLTTLTTPKDQEFFNIIDSAGIDGRNLELFFPLFVVSNFLDNEVFANMIKIAKTFVFSRRSDEMTESRDVCMYDFISSKNVTELEFVSIMDLTRDFRIFMGDIDDDDKWITHKWVGRALRRLDLVGAKKRVARGTQVTLRVAKAREQLKLFKGEEPKGEKG